MQLTIKGVCKKDFTLPFFTSIFGFYPSWRHVLLFKCKPSPIQKPSIRAIAGGAEKVVLEAFSGVVNLTILEGMLVQS